jgi:hypothetical protein
MLHHRLRSFRRKIKFITSVFGGTDSGSTNIVLNVTGLVQSGDLILITNINRFDSGAMVTSGYTTLLEAAGQPGGEYCGILVTAKISNGTETLIEIDPHVGGSTTGTALVSIWRGAAMPDTPSLQQSSSNPPSLAMASGSVSVVVVGQGLVGSWSMSTPTGYTQLCSGNFEDNVLFLWVGYNPTPTNPEDPPSFGLATYNSVACILSIPLA